MKKKKKEKSDSKVRKKKVRLTGCLGGEEGVSPGEVEGDHGADHVVVSVAVEAVVWPREADVDFCAAGAGLEGELVGGVLVVGVVEVAAAGVGACPGADDGLGPFFGVAVYGEGQVRMNFENKVAVDVGLREGGHDHEAPREARHGNARQVERRELCVAEVARRKPVFSRKV